MREVASTEGGPALPICLPPQPPRPPAPRLGPPPSLACRSPDRLLPLRSLSPQATDRPAGQWRQALALLPHTLPLPPRWVCAVCRNRLRTLSVSAFPPSQFALSAPPARNAVHPKQGLALGTAPRFSRVHRPISFLSLCRPFWSSENVRSPTQSKASNSGFGSQVF